MLLMIKEKPWTLFQEILADVVKDLYTDILYNRSKQSRTVTFLVPSAQQFSKFAV